MATKNIVWLNNAGINDINEVGGKNASLGEMIQHLTQLGIQVPMGFATTAKAYLTFLKHNELDIKINDILKKLDVYNTEQLEKTGAQIRKWIINSSFAPDFTSDVKKAFDQLQKENPNGSFAVRSSATAEDLPNASFAGQQETYLNIHGFDNILIALKKVFASLYTDRAIAYRIHNEFDHSKVLLSACIQYMVRSDIGASGVMFTIDTESGFDKIIIINAAYGLGETIVQGKINPDEYYVYKPNLETNRHAVLRKELGEKSIKMIYSTNKKDDFVETINTTQEEQRKFTLTDPEIEELAKYGLLIEKHYQRPMDIEWAKDGETGKLHIVQARSETVKSHDNKHILKQYHLSEQGDVIIKGHSIGQRIGKGSAKVLLNVSEMNKLNPGDVLVTDMTDPDWEPIMKKSSAIVTNRGGRTCHAAIVARELGIPAIVGCVNATEIIKDNQEITVCCSEGETGYIYDGLLDFSIHEIPIDNMPDIPFKIMMNLANPDNVFAAQRLPNHGVGLARLEFIINNMIGIHPNALLNFDTLPKDLQKTITEKISGYNDPVSFYVNKLTEGIASIAAAFYPKPVIVRTSDFKTNEYANLLGGKAFEPEEENPMLGFRGASRYVDKNFSECFKLECQALKKVRDELGLTNVEVMIPFVRTVNEGKRVVQLLAENGLKRGENNLKVIMMCEIPSNAVLAEDFLQHFDGFSIGSNDLTQLTLGLDRDSNIVAALFDERNDAVKYFLSQAITTCNKLQKYIGICGQGPSDYPDLAKWLINEGIGSISLNPDTIVKTWLYLAKNEKT